jgi:release factor glutamine methyltransferase
MKIETWLSSNINRLKNAGIESARLDCLLLLEDELNHSREYIISHGDDDIKALQLAKLNKKINQRCKRIPLAYIRQRQEFYGRSFYVDPKVLIPRPESENIISFIKSLVDNHNHKVDVIYDIGTGSGCLAITIKLELPTINVVATDISKGAIKIANKNASMHEAKVEFVYSDLLSSISPTKNSVIMANLPYVPNSLVTSPEILKEPSTALFSGADGMEHYTRLWQQLEPLAIKPRVVITESLTTQHGVMARLAKSSGYEIDQTLGLIQQFSLKS